MRRARSPSAGTREFGERYAGRQTELMRRLEAEPRVSSATFAMAVPAMNPARLSRHRPSLVSVKVGLTQSGTELTGSIDRSATSGHEVRV